MIILIFMHSVPYYCFCNRLWYVIKNFLVYFTQSVKNYITPTVLLFIPFIKSGLVSAIYLEVRIIL